MISPQSAQSKVQTFDGARAKGKWIGWSAERLSGLGPCKETDSALVQIPCMMVRRCFSALSSSCFTHWLRVHFAAARR